MYRSCRRPPRNLFQAPGEGLPTLPGFRRYAKGAGLVVSGFLADFPGGGGRCLKRAAQALQGQPEDQEQAMLRGSLASDRGGQFIGLP